MPRELTEKQKNFCQSYAKTNSIRTSGEQAGYAKSTIRGGTLYRYLKNPKIIECINIARVNRIYSAEELVKDLNTAMKTAVEAKKPDQIIKIIELKLRLSGLEQLLKPVVPETAAEIKGPKKDLFEEIKALADEYKEFDVVQENNS